MVLLLWISLRRGHRLESGDLFLVYLVTYFFGRFFLEFLRMDPSPVGGLNVNQFLAAATVLVAGSLQMWRRTRTSEPARARIESGPS